MSAILTPEQLSTALFLAFENAKWGTLDTHLLEDPPKIGQNNNTNDGLYEVMRDACNRLNKLIGAVDAPANCYDLGEEPLWGGQLNVGLPGTRMNVEVKRTSREFGTWAVYQMGSVLDRTGKFVYEPMPSSRSDYHIKQTRFKSAQEAIAYYRWWKDQVLVWAEKKRKKDPAAKLYYHDIPAAKLRYSNFQKAGKNAKKRV